MGVRYAFECDRCKQEFKPENGGYFYLDYAGHRFEIYPASKCIQYPLNSLFERGKILCGQQCLMAEMQAQIKFYQQPSQPPQEESD